MELPMNNFYVATMVAVLVTISIASYLFIAAMRGSAALGLFAGLQSPDIDVSDRVKRVFDNWVAAMLARRERQAAMSAPSHGSDSKLTDISLYRGEFAGGRRPRRGVTVSPRHSAGERS
jgi:hypothetical protein